MSFDELFIRVILGLVIGFFVGLTSIGSGVLVLPILSFLLKDITLAVGTTTLYAFLTKIFASLNHIKLKTINWKIVRSFLLGALPSSAFFALLVSSSLKSEFQTNLLKYIIISVILLSIIMMVLDTYKSKNILNSDNFISKFINSNNKLRFFFAIFFGFICGGLVGSTSIGAGIIVIPLLVILFKLNTCEAVGTSIIMAFFMTMITAVIFGLNGQQDYQTAILMSVGSLVGVFYGSKLSIILSDLILRITVITLMTIGLVIMII